MPSFISCPGGAEALAYGVSADQEIITTFGFHSESGLSSENMQQLADVVDEFWGLTMLPLLGNNYCYVRTVTRSLEDADGITQEASGSAGCGGGEGTGLHNNVTFSLKRSGDIMGRSARGRIYLPGLQEEFLTDANHVNADNADAWVAALNAFILSSAADTDFTHVTWSKFSDNAPRETGFPFTILRYSYVDLVLDSQRRRLPGRGV